MLPKLDSPVYELTIPSTNKKVSFRPFTVKEQKALLIAMESPEDNAIQSTILAVIAACLFERVDVHTLAKIDIEYIFVKLRAKSVGEVVELSVRCGGCDATEDYSMSLDDVKVIKDDRHTTNIKLSDNVGLIMRLPTYAEITALLDDYTTENIYGAILNCVEQIYDQDTVHLTKDIPREELENWFEDVNNTQYAKLEEFFETQPELRTTIEYKCKKCGVENKFDVVGIEDFFG